MRWRDGSGLYPGALSRLRWGRSAGGGGWCGERLSACRGVTTCASDDQSGGSNSATRPSAFKKPSKYPIGANDHEMGREEYVLFGITR